MPTTHHGKAVVVVEIRAAWQQRDGLLARIDQIKVFMRFVRRRAHAQNAILTVQNNLKPLRQMVGHQGGHANT